MNATDDRPLGGSNKSAGPKIGVRRNLSPVHPAERSHSFWNDNTKITNVGCRGSTIAREEMHSRTAHEENCKWKGKCNKRSRRRSVQVHIVRHSYVQLQWVWHYILIDLVVPLFP
jgi:hypothetical protein